MSVDSEILREPTRSRPSETVAGYLSSLAIFTSVAGIFWHPLRLILPSLAIALLASGMTPGRSRLQLVAVLICAVCLFLGFVVAVITSHPLW